MNHFNLYLALIEQAPDAVIFANSRGEIELWNSKAYALFGHAADEVVGQSLDIIIPEYLRDAHWKGFRHSIETGTTKYQGKTLVTKSMRKDGSKLYLNLSFSIIKNKTGEVQGALAFIQDITEEYLKDNLHNST